MSDNNRNDGPFLAAALLLIVGVACVWWFSDTFGLDFRTSAQVMALHLVVGAMAWVSWRFGEYSLFSFSNAWPALLGLVWMCWWPALEHWSLAAQTAFYQTEAPTIWWAAWYTKFGVLVLLVGGGYGFKAVMPRNDY